MAHDLRLARYRRPLEVRAALSPSERAQLTRLLDEDGAGSIDEAAANDEWRVELVDVVDAAGAPRFQLYLWPFGSAVLYRAGTTEVVGSAVQHSFGLVEADAGLLAELRAAWHDAAAVGIEETLHLVEYDATADDGAAEAGSIADRLASIPPAADPSSTAWIAARNTVFELRGQLFPRRWEPYPKLRPSELTPDQRELLERAAPLELAVDLHTQGLFQRTETNARLVGFGRRGPSDLEVLVGERIVPLWCVVSDVASGHADAAVAERAWLELPEDDALAAWREIATQDPYELWQPHPLSMKEVDSERTPIKRAYFDRLVDLVARVGAALGAPARVEADAMLRSLPDHGWGAQVFCGLATLARTGGFAEEHDALIPRIRDYNAHWVRVYADAIVEEIIRSLPPERQLKKSAAKPAAKPKAKPAAKPTPKPAAARKKPPKPAAKKKPPKPAAKKKPPKPAAKKKPAATKKKAATKNKPAAKKKPAKPAARS